MDFSHHNIKMKVVYISNSRIPSRFANGIQVMRMCEAIAKLGHDLLLLIRSEKTGIEANQDDIFSFYGVEKSFEIKRTPLRKKSIHGLISCVYARLKDAELCYTRSALAACLASRLGMPTVFEIHQPLSSKVGNLLAPYLFDSPNLKIVSISHALTRFCEENYKINPTNKILTKHDGVDPERFSSPFPREKAREVLGLPQDKKIICYTGNLFKGRGIELLLSVSGNLPENSIMLIVGGQGKDLEMYRDIALRMGRKNVNFLGFVPNRIVPMYLAASDILAMPYENNAEDVTGSRIGDFMSPLKMFEYMASGRPIVASDLPVLREVLKDGENSLLFKPGDERGLLNAIKICLENKDIATKIARNAKNEATNYTWTERAKAILSFSLVR